MMDEAVSMRAPINQMLVITNCFSFMLALTENVKASALLEN